MWALFFPSCGQKNHTNTDRIKHKNKSEHYIHTHTQTHFKISIMLFMTWCYMLRWMFFRRRTLKRDLGKRLSLSVKRSDTAKAVCNWSVDLFIGSHHITSHHIICMCLCCVHCAMCVRWKCTHHTFCFLLQRVHIRVFASCLHNCTMIILWYLHPVETDSSHLTPSHAKMPFMQRAQACTTLCTNDRDFMIKRHIHRRSK